MSEIKKPQEWWLSHTEYKHGTIALLSESSAKHFSSRVTHVIEYSAYEALAKERDELKVLNEVLQERLHIYRTLEEKKNE